MQDHIVHDIPSIDRIRRDYYRGVTPQIAYRQRFAYRGQTREYKLPSTYPPSQGAFRFFPSPGYEPSLVPSSFRAHLNEYFHPAALDDHLYTAFRRKFPLPNRRTDREPLSYAVPNLQVLNERAREVAQHYGLCTNGLDVTYDLDVATWFATQEFISEDNRFQPYHWKNVGNYLEWPVIYVFALDSRQSDYRPLDDREFDFLGLYPLRIYRQKCSVFAASHHYPNTIADDLLFRCFLHPDFLDRPTYSAEYLFPPPHLDQMYQWLLDLKVTAKESDSVFSQIIRYEFD